MGKLSAAANMVWQNRNSSGVVSKVGQIGGVIQSPM